MIIYKCAGCDKVTVVILFENHKFYCSRCAEEIEALGWGKRKVSRA